MKTLNENSQDHAALKIVANENKLKFELLKSWCRKGKVTFIKEGKGRTSRILVSRSSVKTFLSQRDSNLHSGHNSDEELPKSAPIPTFQKPSVKSPISPTLQTGGERKLNKPRPLTVKNMMRKFDLWELIGIRDWCNQRISATIASKFLQNPANSPAVILEAIKPGQATDKNGNASAPSLEVTTGGAAV